MMKSLWISKTGLDAQQQRLAVISNNLANVNTTGYKRQRASFEDLIYQQVRQVGAQSTQNTKLPSGLSIGTGVRMVSTARNFSQGNIVHTDNAFDVAIEGRGFFQVLLPDGNLGYTRDGSFKIDEQGQLVTSNGYIVQPAVSIPSGALSVEIGEDGTVSVLQAGANAPTQVGAIQLADFINPAGLQAIGKNLFLETASSGAPETGTPGLNGLGTLQQGALETSNVNIVEELVNMIETQRAYEMNSKSISTSDQMLQYVTNNL
ncbi:MAG: flagellar basal-body rod protein FlgG [Gammaproteobacteria bacterium]|nr:MAG: flagellar basal-body rod protein FlgG [Gammaproteobacteria bacterium]